MSFYCGTALPLFRRRTLWQGVQYFRGRGPCAVLLDDLSEKDSTLPVDQECRGIGGLVGSIPPQSVQVRELIIGIQHQVEIRRQFLVGQKLVRFSAQILRRTGVYEHYMSIGAREALRVLDEILNLAIAKRALVAGIPPEHHQHHGTLRHHSRKAHVLTLRSRQREVAWL